VDLPHLHSFPTRRSSDLTLAIQPRTSIGGFVRRASTIFVIVFGGTWPRRKLRFSGRPNKRLKLPARIDYGMNRSSARRSLGAPRSEEHTSELQSPYDLVC